MPDVSSIPPVSPAARARETAATQPSHPESTAAARGSDRAEFSEVSRFLSQLAALPDVRQDLVDRVRSEIADGTYESDDKVKAALDGLLDDLA